MVFESDIVYIERVLSGETDAFRYLVEKHKDMIYSVALKITSRKEDAEEIAQDAFLKAFQKLSSFENKSKFSTWLFRIAYNTAVSRVRKKKVLHLDIDNVHIDDTTEDSIQEEIMEQSREERKKLIHVCLEKLNKLDYTIITLFYLKEQSVDDISEITGLSKSNVKVKLHRIRKTIYKNARQMLNNNIIIENAN